MSARLSAVMIAKNVADILPKCLASLKWVDEIILLDSGSEDNTIEIARIAGVKVFINTDWQGYGIQRQRAQRYATGDYVLMIDTDEYLTSELKHAIETVLISPQEGAVYSIARCNYFLGCFIRYGGWYPDRVLRLYERKSFQFNSKRVHESLSCNGALIVPLQGHLIHLTCNNFVKFQQKQLNYAAAWAQDHYQHSKNVSMINVFAHVLGIFLKILLIRGGILDGKRGWLIAVVNAQYTFNKYIELWALNLSLSKREKL